MNLKNEYDMLYLYGIRIDSAGFSARASDAEGLYFRGIASVKDGLTDLSELPFTVEEETYEA